MTLKSKYSKLYVKKIKKKFIYLFDENAEGCNTYKLRGTFEKQKEWEVTERL